MFDYIDSGSLTSNSRITAVVIRYYNRIVRVLRRRSRVGGIINDLTRETVSGRMPSREIMPELPACCFYLPSPSSPSSHPRMLSRLDSKRLNGRFRSRPSYDHPAVSGSPLVELHPREFVVALFHELRPLMRGLGSRAPLRRQTITSRVYAFEGCITTAYRVLLSFFV